MILFWFSLYAYVPQISSYAEELGASYKLIGLIGGAYGFTQTILRIPLGILSDKINKKKLFVLIGLFNTIVSALVTFIYPTPYSLLITRLLAGVSSATWVNFTVLFMLYFSPEEGTKAVSIAVSNSKMGQLFAMIIGGFIATRLGVRTLFLLSTIFGLASFMIGIFIEEIPAKNSKNNKEKLQILSIMKNKRVMNICILGALVQMISYSTAFGFTSLVAKNLGADDLILSYLSVIYTMPQIFLSVFSITLVRRYGKYKVLMIGFILSIILCFAIPNSANLFILFIIQFFSGVGSAITFPILMSSVVEGVESNFLNTVMGFFQAFYGIGMVVGPIILGYIGDVFSLEAGFFVVGILSMISIVLLNQLKSYKV